MGQRDQLQRKIDLKNDQIAEWKSLIRDAEVYIQAMQEAMRIVPPEPTDSLPLFTKKTELRPGSILDLARMAIVQAGRPLHINEILEKIGKPADKRSRVSLGGSIGQYVRKGVIFRKAAPNTFDIIPELQHADPSIEAFRERFGPPQKKSGSESEAESKPITETEIAAQR